MQKENLMSWKTKYVWLKYDEAKDALCAKINGKTNSFMAEIQISEQAVLSISFKVDIPTGKVGGRLLFECRRRELPRGV